MPTTLGPTARPFACVKLLLAICTGFNDLAFVLPGWFYNAGEELLIRGFFPSSKARLC